MVNRIGKPGDSMPPWQRTARRTRPGRPDAPPCRRLRRIRWTLRFPCPQLCSALRLLSIRKAKQTARERQGAFGG